MYIPSKNKQANKSYEGIDILKHQDEKPTLKKKILNKKSSRISIHNLLHLKCKHIYDTLTLANT